MSVFLAMRLLFSAEVVDIISFVRIAYYKRPMIINRHFLRYVLGPNIQVSVCFTVDLSLFPLFCASFQDE